MFLSIYCLKKLKGDFYGNSGFGVYSEPKSEALMIRLLMIGIIITLFYGGCGGSSPIIEDGNLSQKEGVESGSEFHSNDESNGEKYSEDKDESQDDSKKSEDGQKAKDDEQKSEDSSDEQKAKGDDKEEDKKQEESPKTKETKSLYSFIVHTKGKSSDVTSGINSFKLKIKRDGEKSFDNSDISTAINQDNSILITSKKEFKVGDVISLVADGFTPQQQIINDVMIDSKSMRVSLKSIDSRQTFSLGNLNSGRITTRISMGASTKVKGNNVEFKTNNGNVVLNIKKSQIQRMAKRVRRSPKADKNTEIYLDITTIDPKTELSSAIGDFTYEPSSEPKSSRLTSSASSTETMLESVVMTSLSMTTSDGDEIHCFDGSDYDEERGECSGDSIATLKMKIPSSQFDKYADKYNMGERTIPLYHYSTSKSTWVRQVKDDKPMNGELILEDINSNDIADEGDSLYISGEVGHFSYWNGDYPVDVKRLNGKIEVENGSKLPQGSMVVSKGSDYVGRSFRVLISDDLTFSDLGAKADSKVELYIQYPDGSRSDSIFVESSKSEVGEPLICRYKMQEATFVVTDQNNKPLKGAVVQSLGVSMVTDKSGEAKIPIIKDKNTKVTASYDTGNFVSSSSTFANSNNLSISLDTSSFKLFGGVEFLDENGETVDFKYGFVSIYNDSNTLYERVYLDKDGSFNMLLASKYFKDGEIIHIKGGVFVPLYGKFIEQNMDIEITSDDVESKSRECDTLKFALKPFIVTGKVTNPFAKGESKGISNITIYSDSQSVKTDEDGNYRMLLFNNGKEHILRAYDSISGDDVAPINGIYLDKDTDEDQFGQDFTIDKRVATIKGSVVNKKGIPIGGLPIYTNVGWLSTVTDENGQFSFEISDNFVISQDIVLHVYDASDNSKLLSSKAIEKVSKGDIVEVDEIVISTNIAPIIQSVTWDQPVLNQPMNIYVDAYDPDNDEIKTTISFTNGDEKEVNNGIVSITPDRVGNLDFRVITKEVDGDGLSAEVVSSMIVSKNAKPIINSIDGFTKRFDKSSDMRIAIDAIDPEGGVLTFEALLFDINQKNVDSYLSLDDNNITISKDIENGRYNLLITISDGENKIERNFRFIADDNIAPRNLTLLKDGIEIDKVLYLKSTDGEFNLVANAIDDNGDSLDYSWSFPDNLGAILNSTTLRITPAVGIFPITVSVTDAKEYVSKDITLVIANNLKPIIHEIKLNPKTITRVENKLYDSNNAEVTKISVEVNATDPEKKGLSYKFSEEISVSSIDGFDNNKSHVYNISNFKVGRYAFKVDIKDGDGKVASRRVLFRILENKPPKINKFFVPTKAKAGSKINLRAFAIDPEGDDVSYEWNATNGSTSLSINGRANSMATIDIGANISGKINIGLKVTDSKKNIVKRNRTIEIVQNSAPIISRFNVLPSVVKVGQKIIFSAMAYDREFDEISYQWYWNGNLISEKSRGVFEVDQSGDYTIKLVVSDTDKSSEHSEKVTVVALDPKPTVVLKAQKNQILVGSKLTIMASVDITSRLKWSVSEGGEVAAKSDSAIFSADSQGLYRVNVVATNKDGIKSDLVTFEVEVKDVDLELNSPNPSQTIGSEFRIDAKLSDDSFQIPSNARWNIDEKPASSSASLVLDGSSATITPDKIGLYKISLSFEIDGEKFRKIITISANREIKVDDEAHSVHGVVLGDSGEILEDAQVHLYNADNLSLYNETKTTDSDGSYLFSDLPAGRYYLVVSGGDGYINQSEIIVIN